MHHAIGEHATEIGEPSPAASRGSVPEGSSVTTKREAALVDDNERTMVAGADGSAGPEMALRCARHAGCSAVIVHPPIGEPALAESA